VNPFDPETIPLSLLNDFVYCPRRAALKAIEGVRSGNVHTVRGDIVHEHTDLAGYEVVRGAKLLRALPVCSARMGLNGKCDAVPGGVQAGEAPMLGERRCAAMRAGAVP
jgi:CRISPR-associated exonuclease Cas4